MTRSSSSWAGSRSEHTAALRRASAVEGIVARRVVAAVADIVCCHRAVAVVAAARTAAVHRARAAGRSLVAVACWIESAARSFAGEHMATAARSVAERLMGSPQSVLGRRVIALSARAVGEHRERVAAARVARAVLAAQVERQWADPSRPLTQAPR